MSRVLVLRDRESARETARDLAVRGHEPLLLPVQEIVSTNEPLPPGRYSAIAVTSRNAVPALEREPALRETAVLAVGEATAERLRAADHRLAHVGDGPADDLVRPAATLAARERAPVLLALGRQRTSALEDGLEAAGVPFVVWETYETRPLRPTRADIDGVLGGRRPDAVLVLSGGQAAGYAALRETAPDLFHPSPHLLCLSERIAAVLAPELRSLASISPVPNLGALFDLIGGTNFQRHCLASSDGETRKTG